MSLRSRRAMLPKSTSASTTPRPPTMCSPPANRSREVTSARLALTALTTRRLNSSLTSAVIDTRRHPSVRYDPVHLRRSVDVPFPPASRLSPSPKVATDRCRARPPHPAPRPTCPGHVKVYQAGPHPRTEPAHLAQLPYVAAAHARAHSAPARHR